MKIDLPNRVLKIGSKPKNADLAEVVSSPVDSVKMHNLERKLEN